MNTKKLNPKILIVEDDVGTYRNLHNFFVGNDYEVADSKDGSVVDSFEKAIVVQNAQKADMAILDIDIKGAQDGLELGAHLVAHFDIPVIFLTGQDTFENQIIANKFASSPIIEKSVEKFTK